MNKSFPLFDMLPHNNLIFVSGGGGNTIYGKSNGIIVYDTNITELSRYTSNEPIIQIQKYSYLSDIKTEDDIYESVTEKGSLFLVGKSPNSFLLLKFKSFTFTLIRQFDISVSDILFHKDIFYLTSTNEINRIEINKTYSDKVIEEKNYIKKREKEEREKTLLLINESQNESNESQDDLLISDSKIINDTMISQSINDSQSVKLYWDSDIKLLFSPERIRRVISYQNKVFYFTNNKLVSLKKGNCKSFDKISCVSLDGSIIGTGDGKLIYKDISYKVNDFPISGTCKIDNFIYYCTVLGDIKRIKIIEKYDYLLYFFIIFTLVLLI